MTRKTYVLSVLTFLFFGGLDNAANSQETHTFFYTGDVQTYEVPAGITSIQVELAGGDGFGPIGEGGIVEAIIPVTPGETLEIYVGGEGTATTGGYNGGGTPGTNENYGGGGGASDIRVSPYGLADRIAVAGGGGGSASNCGTWTAEGGHGGGLEAEGGCLYSCSDCQYTGSGGTQVAGGIAGPTGHGSCGDNHNGEFGLGGDNTGSFGVGGGGGYYGGGSGCFEGAGGGSSYTHPDAIEVVHTVGGNIGNGYVIITELCVGMEIEVSDYDLCIGEEVTLSATSITGGVAMWDDGIENDVPFLPGGEGTYIFTAVSTSGTDCPVEIEIEVHEDPEIVANADPEIVCFGHEVTLYGSGGAFYTWTPGDIEDDEPFIMDELGTFTFEVMGEDWHGCSGSDEITITVIESPTVGATASDLNICLGESVTLNGTGAATYTWTEGVENGVPFTPMSTGEYSYTVTGYDDEEGCSNEASIDITVNELPEIISYSVTDEVLGSDGSIEIEVTGGTPGYTFDWDNDGTGDFDDSEDLTGIEGGTYTVIVQDENECQDVEENITVSSQVNIIELSHSQVEVYPNPTNGELEILLDGTFNFVILDINGKVLEQGVGLNIHQLNLNDLADGLYFLELSNNTGRITEKIIKK
ncbi:glycine-rich protein [Crocinitomix algicola]|uniref:glycine-rich protein n=1 Tax=Crocinitomix algicola TaxID=1740263 RepID=UPI00087200A9|nr:glycine-rich protein [Crocinitomix algicola]